MKRTRFLKWLIKFGLFALTLTIGTALALNAGETSGLARVDLRNAPVEAVLDAGDGQTLYAEISETDETLALYRSVDNGRTWQNAGTLPSPTLTALTVAADNSAVLYAAGSGGPMAHTQSLWRSEDGGQSWQQFGLSLPANAERIVPDITDLAVDPNRPDTLYVATDGQGVYRFDTQYPGYELVGGPSLYNNHVKSLVISDDSRLYALTAEGLYVTTAADRWAKIETPDAVTTLAVAPYALQTLYAGTVSTGLYRSEDGGQSWQAINIGVDMPAGAALRVTALAVDDQNPLRLVVATAYGVGSQLAPGQLYESKDNGRNWLQVVNLESLITDLRVHNGLIQATTPHGLVKYGRVSETAYGPVEATPAPAASGLATLVSPTPTQIAILIVTVGLAGLVLLNPLHWFERQQKNFA